MLSESQKLNDFCYDLANILDRCNSSTIEYTLNKLNVKNVDYVLGYHNGESIFKGVHFEIDGKISNELQPFVYVNTYKHKIEVFTWVHRGTCLLTFFSCNTINDFFVKKCEHDLHLCNLKTSHFRKIPIVDALKKGGD